MQISQDHKYRDFNQGYRKINIQELLNFRTVAIVKKNVMSAEGFRSRPASCRLLPDVTSCLNALDLLLCLESDVFTTNLLLPSWNLKDKVQNSFRTCCLAFFLSCVWKRLHSLLLPCHYFTLSVCCSEFGGFCLFPTTWLIDSPTCDLTFSDIEQPSALPFPIH